MSGLYTWCLAVSGLYTRCLTVDELDTERRKKQNKRTRENSCLTVRGLYTIAYEVEERHALRCTEVLVSEDDSEREGGGVYPRFWTPRCAERETQDLSWLVT